MASKLALRALGAVALPGALLAVAAPGASAVEISPLSDNGGGNITKSTGTADEAEMLPEMNSMLNGLSLGL